MDHAHHPHHHHRHPTVRDPGGSLLGASAWVRLAAVAVVIALVWAATLWAMADLS